MGPAASILFQNQLTDEAKAGIREEIRQMSSSFDDQDRFWVRHRPFILWTGPEYEEEPQEYVEGDLPGVIGWTPTDTIGFAAMCNDSEDHLLLGEICLHFLRRLGGLIDFGGALSPPIEGEVQQLYREAYFGGGNGWDQWEPHFQRMIEGLPGRFYSVPYVTLKGHEWVYHVADMQFLEAWLHHPRFHMVK